MKPSRVSRLTMLLPFGLVLLTACVPSLSAQVWPDRDRRDRDDCDRYDRDRYDRDCDDRDGYGWDDHDRDRDGRDRYGYRARELFEWRGRVDREVLIVVRGDRVWVRGAGERDRDRGRFRPRSVVPPVDGRVFVRRKKGRGDVAVIEQPSRRNGYTTVIRIRDRRGGDDGYRITAYWQDDRSWNDRARPGRGTGRGQGRGGGRDRDVPWDRRGGVGRAGGVGRPGGISDGRALSWTGSVDDGLEIRIRGDR